MEASTWCWAVDEHSGGVEGAGGPAEIDHDGSFSLLAAAENGRSVHGLCWWSHSPWLGPIANGWCKLRDCFFSMVNALMPVGDGFLVSSVVLSPAGFAGDPPYVLQSLK